MHRHKWHSTGKTFTLNKRYGEDGLYTAEHHFTEQKCSNCNASRYIVTERVFKCHHG